MKMRMLILVLAIHVSIFAQKGKIKQNASLRVIFTQEDSTSYLSITNLNWCDCYVWVKYLNVDKILVTLHSGATYFDTIRVLPFEIWARNLTICNPTTSTDALIYMDSEIRALEIKSWKIKFEVVSKKRKCDEVIIGPGPVRDTITKQLR